MLPRLLILSLIVLLVYMTLWFVVAKRHKRLDTVDSAWGGGFVFVAWLVAIQQPSIRTYMVAAMVTAWSARLTYHLARRSKQAGEDPRYTELSKKWSHVWLRAYFSIFLLQGVLIFLIGLPIITNTGVALPGLRLFFTLGYLVWALGFYIEYKADGQLQHFKMDQQNKGKVLDTGLWQYSRHPNYFGELLQWWGIGLVATQTSFGWLGLIGPLILTHLIRNVSGVPTVEKRREHDKNYQEYKKHTNALLPWPTKSSKA
jgi:steroid 5-alpha reductase family enzyme